MHSAEAIVAAAREWVIYGLHEAGCSQIVYVGFSTRPRRRLTEHRYDAMRHGYKCPVHRWMCHIMRAGRKVEMTILERGSGDWKAAEQKWVAYYGRPNLLNATDGGDGFPDVPEESRSRAREKLRTRTFSDEHRKRISEANKGRKRPDAVQHLRGYMSTLTPEQRSEVAREARNSVTADGMERIRAALAIARAKRWANTSKEQREEIGKRASEQMKRVWAERKATRIAHG